MPVTELKACEFLEVKKLYTLDESVWNSYKNDLLNYDPELTQKYITKKKSVIRFKINDYRPYPF